jgi:hypothetical protein
MSGSKINSVFEVMMQFFEQEGWKFAQVGEKPVFRMSYNRKKISMHCYAEMKSLLS